MVISSRDLVVLEYLLLITEKTINCRLQLSKPYIWHNVSKYRRLCLSSEQLLSRARLKGFMLQPCQWKKQIWAHVRKKRNTTANSHCLSYFPLFVRVLLYVIPIGKFSSETAEGFNHPLDSRTHGLVPECVQVHMVLNRAGEGIQSRGVRKY